MTDTNAVSRKPQVLLRLQDEYGVHLIKKWHDNTLSVEGHTVECAANHNINVPAYFFPCDDELATKLFKEAGKEYRA